MPISRKDFEAGNFKRRFVDRETHPILKFLKSKSNLAFTSKEISKKTNMSLDGAMHMLRVLTREGFLVHKQPYWALKVKKHGNTNRKPKRTNRR